MCDDQSFPINKQLFNNRFVCYLHAHELCICLASSDFSAEEKLMKKVFAPRLLLVCLRVRWTAEQGTETIIVRHDIA